MLVTAPRETRGGWNGNALSLVSTAALGRWLGPFSSCWSHLWAICKDAHYSPLPECLRLINRSQKQGARRQRLRRDRPGRRRRPARASGRDLAGGTGFSGWPPASPLCWGLPRPWPPWMVRRRGFPGCWPAAGSVTTPLGHGRSGGSGASSVLGEMVTVLQNVNLNTTEGWKMLMRLQNQALLSLVTRCRRWPWMLAVYWKGFGNGVYCAVLEECLHVPFCSSSFISWSFMHVNVLVTKEEREEKKSWGEIKLDSSINHSVCMSKYMTQFTEGFSFHRRD